MQILLNVKCQFSESTVSLGSVRLLWHFCRVLEAWNAARNQMRRSVIQKSVITSLFDRQSINRFAGNEIAMDDSIRFDQQSLANDDLSGQPLAHQHGEKYDAENAVRSNDADACQTMVASLQSHEFVPMFR
jgi:hypothetical protein